MKGEGGMLISKSIAWTRSKQEVTENRTLEKIPSSRVVLAEGKGKMLIRTGIEATPFFLTGFTASSPHRCPLIN